MRVHIIIPARYASTRYPGKPLAELTLPDGTRKPLIRLSWEAARQVAGIAAVHVATDDARIAEVARGFGAGVIMTDPDCANGTERCAQALERAGLEADIVINFQGDAPLAPPWFAEALVDEMTRDSSVAVATPVLRCDTRALEQLRADRRAGRVGGTTAVFGADRNALYFSKEVIPYTGEGTGEAGMTPVYHHVGLYAFRPDALGRYAGWAPGALERLEGLEQLRFLEHGCAVRCVPVEARGRDFWELNNPGDVALIEAALRRGT